ncbi:hypothetical protein HPB50_021914 [Hyalomma asiaticum]|uniref:Uncharacterized protein n=1 Tax=Hyalomma asiaticum TaxID=266040 RepID=A0ACB7SYB0_HYAAI|nr:hypothetical protein HPB50_021914 [Hyalomma asiaticum]
MWSGEAAQPAGREASHQPPRQPSLAAPDARGSVGGESRDGLPPTFRAAFAPCKTSTTTSTAVPTPDVTIIFGRRLAGKPEIRTGSPVAASLSTVRNSGGVPVALATSPAAELRALRAWFRLAPKLWFRGYALEPARQRQKLRAPLAWRSRGKSSDTGGLVVLTRLLAHVSETPPLRRALGGPVVVGKAWFGGPAASITLRSTNETA